MCNLHYHPHLVNPLLFKLGIYSLSNIEISAIVLSKRSNRDKRQEFQNIVKIYVKLNMFLIFALLEKSSMCMTAIN